MKAVGLFSGGKDSTAALHQALFSGFNIVGVCIAKPIEDSLIFHYPYTEIAVKLAESMGLSTYYDEVYDDLTSIKKFLTSCTDYFNANYLIAGVLRSDFQRIRLEYIAWLTGKHLILPFWGIDPVIYLKNLYRMGIRFVIVKSMARGIPHDLVGKELNLNDIDRLIVASVKYKFNPAFEGGEAETLVVKAPLLRKHLLLKGELKPLSSEVLNYFIIHYKLVDN